MRSGVDRLAVAMEGAPKATRKDVMVELSVVVVAAVVYFATAAKHVLGGDVGELSTIFACGGVPHPPGYPLYALWLRAFRWIPATSPAHGAALATAVIGVATIAVLQRACRAWGARTEVAAAASLLFAFSPLAWSLATSAETFTLNALIAAAILLVSAPSSIAAHTSKRHGARATFVLGLLAGLGLSNHHTIVLLAPIGLTTAIRHVRASSNRVATVLAGVGGLVVGLVPYAYLLVASHHSGWSWGGTSSVAGLLHHFLRADYGTTQLQSGGGERAPLAHVGAVLWRALLDLPGFLVVSAIAPFVHPPKKEDRAPLLALAASFLLSGPLFVTLFNARLDNVGAVIVERFYLLPEVVLCVLGAIAIESLLGARRGGDRSLLLAVGGVALVAIGVLRAVPIVREHHRPTVELYVRNSLSFLPPNAIVVGKGDHRLGGFLYAREALHLRPDVAFVNPSMLGADWYRAYVASIVGFALDPPPSSGDVDVALLRALLSHDRPVFFAGTPNEAMQSSFASFPIGTMTQILPRGSPLPEPVSLMKANEEVFATFTLEPTPPESPRTWAGNLQFSYARPWTVLAVAFARTGDVGRERACEDRARAFVPWIDAGAGK